MVVDTSQREMNVTVMTGYRQNTSARMSPQRSSAKVKSEDQVALTISSPIVVHPSERITAWVESSDDTESRARHNDKAQSPSQQSKQRFDTELLRDRALVMDDEELIRIVARRTLERRGLDVEVASDVSEAYDLFAQARDAGWPFDVVVLDLTIPGSGGGREAIQRLLALDPNVRAIVCSGYSNDPIFTNFRDHGFVERVQKPFHPDELVAAVRKAIDFNPSVDG